MKLISILSGGMDSATALAWALAQKHEVIAAVHFQYGSKHNAQELRAAVKVANHYEVCLHPIDLPFIARHFKSDLLKTGGAIPEGHYADPSMKRTVVPFRNGIMLAVAAGFAESQGAEGIILGNHAGDHAIYPDCRTQFIAAMADAIDEGTYAHIQLSAPFCDVDKTEIARRGAKLGVPYQLTYSCYNGRELHCGKCGTCFERKEAFAQAGITDPTKYE